MTKAYVMNNPGQAQAANKITIFEFLTSNTTRRLLRPT